MNTESTFAWLDDPNFPLTRHRLMTELPHRFTTEQRSQAAADAIAALPQARGTAWMTETKGLWLTYHIILCYCIMNSKLVHG